MSEQSIPRDGWSAFADGFSGQHKGWLVAVERNGDRGELAANEMQPLQDLAISGDRAVIRAGDTGALQVHELRGLRDVRVAASDEDINAIEHVDLVGPADVVTIRFRTAIAPELVDGAI